MSRAINCASAVLGFLIQVALVVTPALAADGVIEINQAKVTANGGFPFNVNSSGSYRLTGNLIVPSIQTTAIKVNTSHVTIDLNGFSIVGPGTTTLFGGSGIGIDATSIPFVTVYNGEVTGMGSYGIITGHSCRIERMRLIGNAGEGMSTGNACDINHNVVNNNISTGIFASEGSVVESNVVVGNGDTGIVTNGATIRSNDASFNQGYGIGPNGGLVEGNTMIKNKLLGLSCTSADGVGAYVHNTMAGNNSGTSDTDNSCANLGSNSCSGQACPCTSTYPCP